MKYALKMNVPCLPEDDIERLVASRDLLLSLTENQFSDNPSIFPDPPKQTRKEYEHEVAKKEAVKLANIMFKRKDYYSVVELLAPYQNELEKSSLGKLNYSIRKQ